ncbi:MAG TPA: hypothetical protein VHB77_08400, partial [Planctomycetaceae bacterium]|nr:hypothetical protein [Planctomycetaceae bacterium]
TALRQLPTDTHPCRFGLGGWTYEVPDERRLLQLLMADCARRAGKEDKAQESVEQVLASWTADNYPVAIYVRRNSVPGTEVEETYSLRRAELAAWPGKNAALRLDYTSFRRETRPGRQTESRSQNDVEGLVH